MRFSLKLCDKGLSIYIDEPFIYRCDMRKKIVPASDDLLHDDYTNSTKLIKLAVMRLANKTSLPVAELVKIYFPSK